MVILYLILLIPAFITIAGVIFLFTKYKKIGLGLLLSGIAIAGVILLIGNAFCSNMKLGNMN